MTKYILQYKTKEITRRTVRRWFLIPTTVEDHKDTIVRLDIPDHHAELCLTNDTAWEIMTAGISTLDENACDFWLKQVRPAVEPFDTYRPGSVQTVLIDGKSFVVCSAGGGRGVDHSISNAIGNAHLSVAADAAPGMVFSRPSNPKTWSANVIPFPKAKRETPDSDGGGRAA